MKKIIYLIQIVYCLNFFAQKNNDIIFLNPKGFRTNTGHTNYLLGQSVPYIIYNTPNIDIEEPKELPVLPELSYQKLALSGINSLLFEYKNYSGILDYTSYAVFALGNYNIMTDKLLEYANNIFFPNQELLKKSYAWLLPYYLKTFRSLTIEEQHILIEKIEICEKYLIWLNKKNQDISLEEFFKQYHLPIDKKAIGFLKRRVDKNQWKISDCEYWINTLKQDFLPLVKNVHEPSSHYQITDSLSLHLFLGTDHKGDYYILNSTFTILDTAKLILKQNDDLLCVYRSSDSMSFWKLNINHHPPYIEKPLVNNWVNWEPLTPTTFYFETKKNKGLYDAKKNINLIDNCIDLIFFNDNNFLIACSTFPDSEEKQCLLYDYNGNLLSTENIQLKEHATVTEFGDEIVQLTCSYYNASKDKTYFAFKNTKHKIGVFDKYGKLVFPFEYDVVDFTKKGKPILKREN